MKRWTKRMTLTVFSWIIITLFAGFAYCTDWRLYYESEAGQRFYFDKESIEYPQKNVVKVWQKVTLKLSGDEEKDKFKAHMEIDCKKATFEIIEYDEYVDGQGAAETPGGDKSNWSRQEPPCVNCPGQSLFSRIEALRENVCP